MRFVIQFFVFVASLLLIAVVSAKTLEFQRQCGEYTYIVTVDNPKEMFANVIKHYLQKKGKKRIFFYQSEEHMLVEASCIKRENKSPLFIFQEHCPANTCVEDRYGLFDPRDRVFLLRSADWPKGNHDEVIKIVGFEPPIFYDEDDSFCCNAQLGEYNNYWRDI